MVDIHVCKGFRLVSGVTMFGTHSVVVDNTMSFSRYQKRSHRDKGKDGRTPNKRCLVGLEKFCFSLIW